MESPRLSYHLAGKQFGNWDGGPEDRAFRNVIQRRRNLRGPLPKRAFSPGTETPTSLKLHIPLPSTFPTGVNAK